MEIKHIQLEYESVLSGKKRLLVTEINLLEILKIIRNYRLLRRQQFILKNKLKSSIKSVENSLESVYSYVPKEEFSKIKKERNKIKLNKEGKKDIQSELEEIKKKLEKLG